jgi:dienelactone hydrolase
MLRSPSIASGHATVREIAAREPIRRSIHRAQLIFLARQDFVDSSRVAVIGFSQGGMAALRNAEQDSTFAKSHSGSLRAAVAFYPDCGGISGIMSVPTLVLVGDLDDWGLPRMLLGYRTH